MDDSDKKPGKDNNLRRLIAFSNIGVQMLVTILLFVYIGRKLDEQNPSEGNTWSIVLTLSGVLIAIYFMIKGLLKILRRM